MLARPHRPRLSSRISSRLRLARRRPPPHRARGTRWLHSVPPVRPLVASAPTVVAVAVAGVVAASSLLEGPALCWTAQHTVRHAPGCASVLCSALGRLAADVAIRPPSAASAGLHRFSTVWRVVRQRSGRWRLWHWLHRAPTVRLRWSCALAINVPGPPGALFRWLRSHPGTPLKEAHGTRTPWCSRSTPCRSPRTHLPNGMPTPVLALI